MADDAVEITAESPPAPNKSGLRPPWPKGVSGNPKGRPKNVYREAIDKALPPEDFARIVEAKCRKGDSRIIAAMLDRYAPKPDSALKVEAFGADGAPLFKVEFVKPEDDDSQG